MSKAAQRPHQRPHQRPQDGKQRISVVFFIDRIDRSICAVLAVARL